MGLGTGGCGKKVEWRTKIGSRLCFRVSSSQYVFTISDRGCVMPVSSLLTSIHEAFQAGTSELSKLKAIWEFLGGKSGEGMK